MTSQQSWRVTGIDWLGCVPGRWEVMALKWHTPVKRGASPRPIDDQKYFDDEGEYAWVRIADVSSAGDYLRSTTQRLSRLGASLSVKLQPGDLFLSIAGTVGKPCISGIKACIHDGFVHFPRLSSDPRFLFYIFASGQPYAGLGKLGTQLNLNTDTVGSIRIAFPPAVAQRAIADFLDKKTAAIDALIAKKERLIELLQEKRQALITQAVTKGLDPNVKMKDSGIEWLGEIPAHWEVLQLRRAVRRFVDFRGRTPEKTSSGVPLITAGAVRNGLVVHERCPEWVSHETYRMLNERGTPERGDLLFTSEAPLGEVGLVEGPQIACAQRIIMFKVQRRRMVPEFLRLHFLSPSGRAEIESRGSGSTAEGIRADRLKMSLVPAPPCPEQVAIVEHVSTHTAGFERLIETITHHIGRLREYRQALITAAVTGKLDISSHQMSDVTISTLEARA